MWIFVCLLLGFFVGFLLFCWVFFFFSGGVFFFFLLQDILDITFPIAPPEIESRQRSIFINIFCVRIYSISVGCVVKYNII